MVDDTGDGDGSGSVKGQGMKADRRHELQENELAQTLATLRTNVSEKARPIGIALLAVVAVFVITGLTMRSRAVAKEDQWRRLGQLMFDKPETAKESFDALSDLAKNSSDKGFLLAALMEQGRQALGMAQRPDSQPDRQTMDRATDAFDQLLKNFPANPLAVGIAHCGLATVAENMFVLTRQQKYKDEAAKNLNAVVKSPIMAGMPFQRIALDRLAVLDQTFSLVEFGPPAAPAAAAPVQGAARPVITPPSVAGTGVPISPTPAPPPAVPPDTDPADSEYGVDTPETAKDDSKPPAKP